MGYQNCRRSRYCEKKKKNGQESIVCTLLDNKGPVMLLPVSKGRTVTVIFYKNVLKKLKAHFKRPALKQDSSTCALCMIMFPPRKANIVTESFKDEFSHTTLFT